MPDSTEANENPLGTLRAADGKAVVRMEDRYRTDIDDLWSAITNPERLARWVARVEGDLRPGGVFHANFTSSWDGPGRIDVCEPPRRLLLTMSPGQDDQTVIAVELAPDGDFTHLVVEERGLPLDEGAAHGAGWQVHIEDLAAHLAGRPSAAWRVRWTELIPVYREQQRDLG
ncbi:MAG: SRPBCC family protein [Chloroflexota bacterium]|nr:SRPBCC family protein [Chloroflexota bacterium]